MNRLRRSIILWFAAITCTSFAFATFSYILNYKNQKPLLNEVVPLFKQRYKRYDFFSNLSKYSGQASTSSDFEQQSAGFMNVFILENTSHS